HLKKDCKGGNVGKRANGSSTKGSEDGSSNPLKGQSMFNKSHHIYYVTFVSEAFFVQDDDIAWWVDSRVTVHVCKDRCWFKTYESLNDGSILHMRNESTALVHGRGYVDLSDLYDLHATPSLRTKKYFVTFIDDASRTNRGGEYMDTLYFQFVGIIYETTASYTPQQNGISERKNIVLKEMVNYMLSYSGLSQGFWGEAMLTAYYLLNRVPNKRNQIIPYELWTKKKPNLNYLRVWGCRAVVRLPDPKLKTLGERGIECIFVGYAKHSKAFRFYIIEPNDSVAINSIIESRDVIFDEHRFLSAPRPSQRSLVKGTENSSGSVVSELEEFTKEVVTQKTNPELIKRTRDKVSDQHYYCFNVEDDPKTSNEAMKSQDVAFWKEAINDEMNFIMGNNTWVLPDLPPCCKPLGCKERDLKGFRQKSDKFDEIGKRVIICLYVDDMLIFGTNQVHVDLTKEFLSSRFSMKDMGEANVIMVSTPMDTSEKPMPNNGQAASQLEYSRVIGSLMYAMTCNRPDIAFAVGKLSRITDAARSSMLEDNSFSKKQTYIQLDHRWNLNS
ncbi:zinc finger, CCHC-type containing protein, partial [Tanacetum coccineum]